MNNEFKYNLKSCRVLHVTGSVGIGGTEKWIMSLLHKADRSNITMDICVTMPELTHHVDEIKSLGSKVIPCKLKPKFTFVRRLEQIIREGSS